MRHDGVIWCAHCVQDGFKAMTLDVEAMTLDVLACNL